MAQQECLRLNTGVMVTPLTSEPDPYSSLASLSTHSRPGPASSPSSSLAAADSERWMPFADYLSPKRNTVSYTAVLPAGQDPRTVFLGWTTAQFCYVASQFHTGGGLWNSDSCEYGQRLECVSGHESHSSSSSDSRTVVEYSNSSAYMLCVKQLLPSFTDQNIAASLRYSTCTFIHVHLRTCIYTCMYMIGTYMYIVFM